MTHQSGLDTSIGYSQMLVKLDATYVVLDRALMVMALHGIRGPNDHNALNKIRHDVHIKMRRFARASISNADTQNELRASMDVLYRAMIAVIAEFTSLFATM
jgi:hypothetical protein